MWYSCDWTRLKVCDNVTVCLRIDIVVGLSGELGEIWFKMAAIISQIAANKRARAKSAYLAVSSDKCVYEIPPFDPCFDPLVHNKFMRAMAIKKQFELDKFVASSSTGNRTAPASASATASAPSKPPTPVQVTLPPGFEKPVIRQGRYVKGKTNACHNNSSH